MIIGSTALRWHFPDFPREPKDIDYIGFLHDNPPEGLRLEKLNNPILEEWYDGMPPTYIDKDELYTLKISHCFWDLENGSWQKHMWDVQWLKEKGCKLIPNLFYKLFDYWESVHSKRKASNLDMTAAEFFDNALDYPFDHDYVHEVLIKHPYFEGQAEPTYKKVLKDGAEVDVDMNKFEALTYKEKFNLTFEECANMATERYSHMYYKKAYEVMLKKFILSHCKIEQGIWIIQNHKELLTQIPFNFIQFLNSQLHDSTTV